jgi:hypothetical protein
MIEPKLQMQQISEIEKKLDTTNLDSHGEIQQPLQENRFKNKKHQRNYSSVSYIKTPYELELPCEMRKSVHIGNFQMKGIFNEERLFEHIRSRGLVDSNLENKISEYKSNLSKEGRAENYIIHKSDNNQDDQINNQTHNLSLRIEFNILKASLESSNKQLSSLMSILNMKKKKLEILEDTLIKIQQKKEDRKKNELVILDNQSKSNQGDQDNKISQPENNFKRKGKTRSISLDKKMIEEVFTNSGETQPSITSTLSHNSQHTKSNSIVSVNPPNVEVENLKRELETLKQTQEEELKSYTESLNKKNNLEIKNEKIKFEEKLRELNSDNQMLVNSLQNEKEFLKKKIKVKIKFFNFFKIYFIRNNKTLLCLSIITMKLSKKKFLILKINAAD